MTKKAKLDEVTVDIDFGIFKLGTKWVDDPKQRDAAWALAIELFTRVATQSIGQDGGRLREAMTSMHTLFGVFREVLRGGGPDLGIRRDSIGGAALIVLNKVLRPFLSEWHPRLAAWETQQGGPKAERDWPDEIKCRAALLKVQEGLAKYANVLAVYAGALPESG